MERQSASTTRSGSRPGEGAEAFPGSDVSRSQNSPDSTSAASGAGGSATTSRESGFEHSKSQVKEQAQRVKSHAEDAGRDAKRQASDMADRARRITRDYSSQLIDSQKQRLAEQLGEARDAANAAVEKLRGDHDDNIAGYLDNVAGYLDRAQRYLSDHDARSLLNDAQDLARRKPAWFLGGMFIAGVAIARFAKAESPSRSDRGESFRFSDDESLDGGEEAGFSPSSSSATLPSTPAQPVSSGSSSSGMADETATGHTPSTGATATTTGSSPSSSTSRGTSGAAGDVGGLISGGSQGLQQPGKELQ